MSCRPRRRCRAVFNLFAWLLLLASLPSWAAEKTRLHVDDYQIDAELTPHTHRIAARAKVKFTALENINAAVFELHNDLRVTKVPDHSGKEVMAERIAQDPTVRGE